MFDKKRLIYYGNLTHKLIIYTKLILEMPIVGLEHLHRQFYKLKLKHGLHIVYSFLL